MIFNDLIGQTAVKSKLKFYADSHKSSGISPFLMFNGSKGSGKTAFARKYSRQLCKDSGKTLWEINASTLRNNRQFFENLYPRMVDNKLVLFFDEAHEIPHDLQNDLLTILNTEKTHKVTYDWNGQLFDFDFSQWTILFSTTDPQKLSSALRDRMTTVDFEEYKVSEMAEIISLNTGLTFDDGLIEEIALTCRGNPRSSVLMGKDLVRYAEQFGSKHLDRASWEEIKSTLGIKPYGLTNDEYRILTILKDRGPSTLTTVCGVTGNTRGYNLMLESYLLKHGLISIEGLPVRRILTAKGLKVFS